MSIVLRVWLITVEPQRLEHRNVLDGEQNCFVTAHIRMLMPGPRWYCEKISLVPVKAFTRNDAMPLSGKHMVDGTARLAMRACVYTGPNELDIAADGPQRGTTRGRVGELHGNIVERAGVG